jgi:hypothetical protein
VLLTLINPVFGQAMQVTLFRAALSQPLIGEP